MYIPKFLSKSEIDSVISIADNHACNCGVNRRDKNGVPKYADYSWKTIYVHTDNLFQRLMPQLFCKIKEKVLVVDKDMDWGLTKNTPMEKINARTIEVHEGLIDGGLPNFHHFDGRTRADFFIHFIFIDRRYCVARTFYDTFYFNIGGSLITIDIMLSKKGDFEGGDFCTLEADGTLKKNAFDQGDALIFISHKKHCVSQITRGRRQVLVLEFWEGQEKNCAHRCVERFNDQCKYSLLDSKFSSVISNISEDL